MQIAAVKALPSLGLQTSSIFGDAKFQNCTFCQTPKEVHLRPLIRASFNWPKPPPGYQESPYPPQPQQRGYQQQPQGDGYHQQQQGPPQGGYQQQGPPQGYQGPPQGGYQQQGPPQGYQQHGPPQGYQQQGPPQGYQQQGPPQGYQQGGYQQQGPPQGGYQQQQQQQNPAFQQPGSYQQGPPPDGYRGYQQQGPPPASFPQQGPPPSGYQQQGPPQQQRYPPNPNFQPNPNPPLNFQQNGPPPSNFQSFQQNGPPPQNNFQQNGPPPQNNFQQNGPPQNEFGPPQNNVEQNGPLPLLDFQDNGPSSPRLDPTSSGFTRPMDSRPKFRSRNNSSGLSGSLGLNFPGSQIPGLPGSPRPKPGTPRPYDPTKQKSKVMEWLTPPKPPTELLQREHFKLSDTCSCTIFFGDLSKWTVDGKSDAVIAPANKKLNTGPAVNAVLFKAAGSKMLECTQRIPDVAPQGIKAEMGDAISTRAFDLPVARVIHTVGSVYKKNAQTGVRESDALLEKAYKTALMIARKENLKYLAFPPLSCNIYGYPYADGAEVAIKALKENCEGFLQIDIVIRNIEGYDAFIEEAHKRLEVVKEKKTLKVKIGDDGSVVSGTVIETTNAIPNSPYARTVPRIDPSLPPAAAEKAAAMAAASEASAAAAAVAEVEASAPPPGAREYVPPAPQAPESTAVPPRERASPIPPSGPPPTPPSTPTMAYPTQYYQK